MGHRLLSRSPRLGKEKFHHLLCLLDVILKQIMAGIEKSQAYSVLIKPLPRG